MRDGKRVLLLMGRLPLHSLFKLADKWFFIAEKIVPDIFPSLRNFQPRVRRRRRLRRVQGGVDGRLPARLELSQNPQNNLHHRF